MYYYVVPLLLLGFLNLFLGALVSYRDKSKPSNLSFTGLVVSVGFWCIGISGLYLTTQETSALNWTRIYYAAPITIVYSLIIFAITFGERFISKKQLFVFAMPGLILLAALFFYPNFLVLNLSKLPDNSWDATLDMTHYLLYGLYVTVYFIIGLSLLYLKARKDDLKSYQAKLFFVGISISALLGLTFNLILPALGNYSLIWAGPLATAIFAIFAALSIARYKMFDIRLFVLRALIYTISTLILSFIYVGPVVYLLLLYFDAGIKLMDFIILVAVATFIATNYGRFKARFDRATSRIFFRDSYDSTQMIIDLNKSLVGAIDINKILNTTSAIIEQNLNPEFCYYILPESKDGQNPVRIFANHRVYVEHEQALRVLGSIEKYAPHRIQVRTKELGKGSVLYEFLDTENIAFVMKLMSSRTKDSQLLGYFVLGVRKSGKEYEMADVQVLETISNTLTIAMQNALNFEKIQRFNATLQGRVDEATRKYRLTNEKLKKLDETKDEFISMASHQLRTPLTSVKGYLSMVLEGDVGPLNKQQEELLKQSFLSSQRMVNLIADLLNLSRLNTGKFVIDAHPIDLRDVVDSELMQLRETAKAKDIELAYVKPLSFPILNMDENKIHQVVMNFVDNAIYYTPNGGKITVALHETPTTIEYTVTDNGIGVPREVQRHLFTKFYRADNAKRARPDGTGLGLFMAKKVVIAQGGSVLFDSEEGEGSTFGFRFNKSQLAVPARKV